MGLSTHAAPPPRTRVCVAVCMCMYVRTCARGQLARERQTTEPEVKQTVMDGLTETSEEETGRSQDSSEAAARILQTSRILRVRVAAVHP